MGNEYLRMVSMFKYFLPFLPEHLLPSGKKTSNIAQLSKHRDKELNFYGLILEKKAFIECTVYFYSI
jgi:hypothetical protein